MHFRGNLRQLLRRYVRHIGQAIWTRDLGHSELVLYAALHPLERRRHVEDGPTMLDSHDASIRKAAPVPSPINLINDRRLHVTAT